MERLTYKAPDSEMVWFKDKERLFEPCEMSAHQSRLAIAKLAAYEDAEEQGLLLRLPYPLGTERIYFIDKSDMEIYELDGRKIEVSLRDISEDVMYTIDCYDFLHEDFGEVVFLTREEAEAKLAEMEKNHEV